jgi:hypothetical protein
MTDVKQIDVPGGYVLGGDKEGAEAFVAARAAELGRKCGSCSLCRKLLDIEEEDITKPAHTWCQHCRPGHGGCSIYQRRPFICRIFACQWLIDGELGDEWAPMRSKMVLRMTPGPGKMALHVYVDDPTAWRRSPYLEQLRERSVRMYVVIRYRERCIAISPDREVEFCKGEVALHAPDGWFVIAPEERAAEISRDLNRRHAQGDNPFARNEPGVRFTRGVSF